VEEWREIEGYEGFYEVSNMGRVRRVKKYHGRTGVIKPQPDGRGYLHVRLSRDNKVEIRNVHRLVGKAFLPIDERRPYINHKDGQKDNNMADNLEWCTAKENYAHAVNALGFKAARGFQKPNTKLSLEQVSEIRLLAQTNKQKDIAEMFGVSKSLVSNIVRNNRRKES